jgi:hypothetical protein
MKIRRKRPLGLNEPLRHPDHARPLSRRDFLAQGFVSGTAVVVGGSVLGLFANPRAAHAALSSDIDALATSCGIVAGAGLIPFIAFDLASGANIAGQRAGWPGGCLIPVHRRQQLGLPGVWCRIPPAPRPSSISGPPVFHDSALRGILSRTRWRGGPT